MSNVDVFDITLTQLEDFSNVTYEDLSVFDCLDKYLVVTTWSWFGQQARSMMVAYDPIDDKEKALRYANTLYTNDLMSNRMGITHTGNHYEVWHVVEDPIPTPSVCGFEGEGWYTVSYSDGGQDYTNDGPVWVEDALSFAELLVGAMETATDTHVPYAEYHGTGDYPAEFVDENEPEPVDWFGEMGDTLGEDYSECIEAYEYVRAIDEMF